jgi:hypothetical protein
MGPGFFLRLLMCAIPLASSPTAFGDELKVVSAGSCRLIDVEINGRGNVTWDKVQLSNRVLLESKLVEAQKLKPHVCINLIPSVDGTSKLGPLIMLMQKYGFPFQFVTRPGDDAPESMSGPEHVVH